LAATLTGTPAMLVAQTDTNTPAPATPAQPASPAASTPAPATPTPLEASQAPVVDQTQTNTVAKAKAKKPARKKTEGKSSKGALEAVDNVNKTITVGKKTYQITSQTIIFKDGKYAILGDAAVGESATVTYKKEADGTLSAATVHFGEAKVKEPKHKKTKAAPANSGTSTNQPPATAM
jgi:predicted membrane-bound mannosyltransferase